MSGIAGFASRPDDPAFDAPILRSMIRRLAHRGPDAVSLVIDNGVGLGHCRLSIIDQKGGRYPLIDDDGQVALVFDGTIYNHQALRRELISIGAQPRTGSDGEVIVHGYRRWGLEAMLRRLRGMYAFALYDRQQQALHLVRDPFGLKPLFYVLAGESLVYASEIKAIVGVVPGPWELARRGLLQTATLGFTLAPDTIYKRVSSLQAGHYLTWRRDKVVLKRHHEHRMAPDEVEEDPERLWHGLKVAVRSHLAGDEPVAAALSGGLDSAAIVAAWSEVATEPVRAVALGLDGASLDERSFARELAAECDGVRLYEELATPSMPLLLPRLVWHMDRPFIDTAVASVWHIAEAARRHVKVALCGYGCEQNFAGRRGIQTDLVEERCRRVLPRQLRRHLAGPFAGTISNRRGPVAGLLRRIALDWLDSYVHGMTPIAESAARRLLRPEVTDDAPLRAGFEHHAREVERLDPLSRILAMDFRTRLADDLLVKIDRMSAAHGLEIRLPFLDGDLAAYAARLPNRAKFAKGESKQLLRQALEGRVPERVLRRPRHEPDLPIEQFLTGPLIEPFEQMLAERTSLTFDFLDPAELRAALDAHRAGKADRRFELWFAMTFDTFLHHGAHAQAP